MKGTAVCLTPLKLTSWLYHSMPYWEFFEMIESHLKDSSTSTKGRLFWL